MVGPLPPFPAEEEERRNSPVGKVSVGSPEENRGRDEPGAFVGREKESFPPASNLVTR